MICVKTFETHGKMETFMRQTGIHKENVVQITHAAFKYGADIWQMYTLIYESR